MASSRWLAAVRQDELSHRRCRGHRQRPSAFIGMLKGENRQAGREAGDDPTAWSGGDIDRRNSRDRLFPSGRFSSDHARQDLAVEDNWASAAHTSLTWWWRHEKWFQNQRLHAISRSCLTHACRTSSNASITSRIRSRRVGNDVATDHSLHVDVCILADPVSPSRGLTISSDGDRLVTTTMRRSTVGCTGLWSVGAHMKY